MDEGTPKKKKTWSKFSGGFLVLSNRNNCVNVHKISACSFETLTQMKHATEYHYRLQKHAPFSYILSQINPIHFPFLQESLQCQPTT